MKLASIFAPFRQSSGARDGKTFCGATCDILGKYGGPVVSEH